MVVKDAQARVYLLPVGRDGRAQLHVVLGQVLKQRLHLSAQ
jgi:hypothetical protein